jgi:LPXTG-motif cell wall-anchored protein
VTLPETGGTDGMLTVGLVAAALVLVLVGARRLRHS